MRHCLDNLAKYKVPKSDHFPAELPHNATGKILKTELSFAPEAIARRLEFMSDDHHLVFSTGERLDAA